MDQSHFNTIEETRKAGRHLSLEERGMIQALHRKGYSLRSIAAEVNCAHTTVFYELRRGTPEKRGSRGRIPQYTAKRGHNAYLKHRKNSRKPCKVDHDDCEPFIQWMARQVREELWSLDACVGYARQQNLFRPEHIFPAQRRFTICFGPEKSPCPYLTCLMYSGAYATGSGYGKTGASKGAVLRNAPPLSAKEQKLAIGKWIPSLASVKVVKPSRSLLSKR